MYGNPNDGWEGYERMQPAPAPKITAAYQANALTDGVLAPMLKSFFIGFSLGVLAGLLCWQLHWPPNVSPWLAWLIVWFFVMPLAFLTYSERGQWLIERITGADLNGDGYRGQPPTPAPALPESVHIELIQDGGRQGDYIDLPATPAQLKALANGIVKQRRQFALTLWTGDNGIFTRPQFERLRAELIERGLAEWKKEGAPNQGCNLTPQGLAVMRYFASDHYSPTTRE